LAIVLVLFLWRVIWVSKKENILVMQQTAQIQEQNASLAALNEEVSQQRDNLLILHEESESQKAFILKQNEELQVTNEKLSEMDREKDGLMGVVAHDLKAPLNRTIGLSHLIRVGGTLNELQENYLQLIEKVVKDGNQLILDLLTLTQAQQPVVNEPLVVLNLHEWIKTVIKGYEGQATSKQISLHYQPRKVDCNIKIDERSLTRIIDNLLSNALKFSEPGKNITIGIDHDAEQFTIFIQDEGPGISIVDQAKLFQKFQRLSAQPTQGESSTGLGLAIVKTLVEKIGGEIKVESQLGKGTRFALFLPSQMA
jgi:signal transduction histidine kinase